jgi:hypothetical protein
MEPDAGKVFDAAKAIVKTLQSMDKTQQQQALRFASESLGLGLGATPSAPATTPPLTTANSTPSSVTSAQSADIKQFTMAKKPKSDQQFAAVVAYYYRFEAPASDRKDVIGSDDLTQAARLAGRERPTRPTLTLNNAKNSGYLDSAERGKFRINAVGENLVAVTLPGSGGGDAGSDGNRRRTQRKKKTSKRKGRRAGE